jgi:hypothetical protein
MDNSDIGAPRSVNGLQLREQAANVHALLRCAAVSKRAHR